MLLLFFIKLLFFFFFRKISCLLRCSSIHVKEIYTQTWENNDRKCSQLWKRSLRLLFKSYTFGNTTTSAICMFHAHNISLDAKQDEKILIKIKKYI